MPGNRDRKAHGSGAAARRRIGRDADAVAGQPDHAYARQVADTAIGDEAHGATVAGHTKNQIAGDCTTSEARGGRDQHIALLHRFECSHQRKVVRGAGVASQRHAAKGSLVGDRGLDSVIKGTAPTHRIDDETGRRAAQRVDQCPRGPNHAVALYAWRFVDHCHILQSGGTW